MTTTYCPVSKTQPQTDANESQSLIQTDRLESNEQVEIGNIQETAIVPIADNDETKNDDILQSTMKEDNPLDTKNPATIPGSIYNLTNTAVGAGILALSYGTAQVGWILAIFLFVGCAIMTAFTLHINGMAAKIYRPKSSYKVLSDACFPYFSYFADFIIALNTFGACCAYLIIVGDLWPDIMRHFNETGYHSILYERRLWIAIFFVIFILPCIYFRKLHALRWISLFGMVCYIFITIVVLAYSIIGIGNNDEGLPYKGDISAAPLDPLNFFRVLPMFIFAYGCLMNVYPIVNELGNFSKAKLNIIVDSSMSFTFILYIIMGFAGYFTLGSNAASNLLKSYPTDITAILVARILLSFCVTFSYPVIFSPCRHCLASLFFRAKNANKDSLSNPKFVILTTFIWILTIIVSMTVEDLGYVIAVDGAIAVTAMTLILPGLYYWYIKPNEELIADPWYKFKKYSSIMLTIIGCFLVPFCVAMIFV